MHPKGFVIKNSTLVNLVDIKRKTKITVQTSQFHRIDLAVQLAVDEQMRQANNEAVLQSSAATFSPIDRCQIPIDRVARRILLSRR